MLARLKLGMFDPPELVPYANPPASAIDSEKNKKIALQMARESIVLLKNENNILPLSKEINKIAVIGPNADDHEVLYGNYHGWPSHPVSVLEGFQKLDSDIEILYSKGSELVGTEDFKSPVPVKFLSTPDKEPGLLATYYPNKDFSGNPVHTRIEKTFTMYDEFGPPFEDLQINNFCVRWEGYLNLPESSYYKFSAMATPHYNIFIDDKLVESESKKGEYINLIANTDYKICIEFVSDADGFSFVFVHSAENQSLKKNALQIAQESDIVIMAMGISSLLEEESLDRDEIELPHIQQTLIKEILKLDKPTVLVILGGGAIAFDDEVLAAPAIVEAWYPGQSGGTAVADVIFGNYNPAGRLPVTFYKSTSDLPPFEDYSMENRTYKYFNGKPLFPFGYGMSYTTFEYSNLKLPVAIQSGEPVQISIDVKNSGNFEGDEVLQLYVKDIKASVRVPIHSLQGFKRLHLKKDEKQTVYFKLLPKNLALLNEELKWMVESGEFLISVGGRQPLPSELLPGDYGNLSAAKLVVTGKNFLIE
jgi:beta-glucosidase